MKHSRTIAFALCAGVLVGTQPSQAGGSSDNFEICRAPFSKNALEVQFQHQSQSSFSSLVQDIICDSRFEGTLRDRSLGIQAIIPEYNIPIGISGQSSAKRTEWEKSCKKQLVSVSQDSFNQLAMSVVDNKEAVKAFGDCVHSVTGGLFFSASPVAPRAKEAFAIKTEWRPTAAGLGSLKVSSLQIDGATCTRSELQGKTLGVNGQISMNCKRDGDFAVLITINTKPQYTASVHFPRIDPPPTEFSYSYDDLDNLGFKHHAPVDKSPRYVAGQPQKKAEQICAALKHDIVVGFTLRDEDRAIHDITCKNKK